MSPRLLPPDHPATHHPFERDRDRIDARLAATRMAAHEPPATPSTSELIEGLLFYPIALVISATIVPGLSLCIPGLLFVTVLILIPVVAMALVVVVAARSSRHRSSWSARSADAAKSGLEAAVARRRAVDRVRARRWSPCPPTAAGRISRPRSCDDAGQGPLSRN